MYRLRTKMLVIALAVTCMKSSFLWITCNLFLTICFKGWIYYLQMKRGTVNILSNCSTSHEEDPPCKKSRQPRGQARVFCPHCEDEVAVSTFKKHKRRFFNQSDRKWITVHILRQRLIDKWTGNTSSSKDRSCNGRLA